MPSDHRQEVRRVFMEIVDLPEAERASALSAACEGNLDLRMEVEALLAADMKATAFIPSSLEGVSRASAAGLVSERAGAIIGPYKLQQLIGEGGFGIVFMAEQEKPVARKVALKIIKLGMDTRQVIARFEAERQALEILEHPNIARVLDAGTTEFGRPYFVMELVDGEPISDYCDQHNLTVQARLELFAQVCSGVQHAHTKGIIHRDIKPSNILVSTIDGRPTAKVIDFGIAKATASTSAEKAYFTEHRQLIGTPEYMSPEQAEGSLDIDTRSDVYSLGVLLYELLTGSTPFDTRKLRSAAFDEMRRIIREVDPPRPSTRLSQAGETLASVAAARRIEPRKLSTVIRGELDWIVMKSMEKDRSRRYESASAFAADINRYLAGDAVIAAPPSNTYRLRKFIHRYRRGVLAGSAIAAALVIGLAGFAWQARIASHERDIAGQQRDLARQEAARATATKQFLENMFLSADPQISGARELTVAQMLSSASVSADKTLGTQPLVEAYARALLGMAFRSLGQFDQASSELARALAIQVKTGEMDTIAMAGILRNIGVVHMDRGEFKDALTHFQQAQKILASLQPAQHADAIAGHTDLARAHLALSQFPECERELDAAEALSESWTRSAPGQQSQHLGIRALLVKAWKNDQALAESLTEQEVAVRRLENSPIGLAEAINNLAVIRMNGGELDDALVLYNEALGISRAELGDSHPRVAIVLENCGNIYYRKKDYAQAQTQLDQALKIRETTFGVDSMPAARTRLNMAFIAVDQRDFVRGFELADSALPHFHRNSNGKSMDYVTALRLHAVCLKGKGELDAALLDFTNAVTVLDEIAPPTSVLRLRCLQSITEIHCQKGAALEAETAANQALSILDVNVPAQAKWVETFQQLLAECAAAKTP